MAPWTSMPVCVQPVRREQCFTPSEWNPRWEHPSPRCAGYARASPDGTDESPDRTRHRAETTLLIGSLVLSAYLMGVAVCYRQFSWISWLALFPLLIAIRVQTPLRAALFGVVWGLSLYAFLRLRPEGARVANPSSLALLGAVPAIYAWLGASLTRWVGFSPLVLGVGWIGVEAALAPVGLRYGLLAGAQENGVLFHLIGHGLGYVFVAFLAAYVCALVVTILSRVCARATAIPPRMRAAADGMRLWPQTCSCLPLWAVDRAQPRAPPIPS